MPEAVGVIDTGVFCCWLEVPGKETAGTHPNFWDNSRARTTIDALIAQNGTLVLANSVVLEVGRMIAHASYGQRTKAEQLHDRTIASLDATSPWRKFDETNRLWSRDWYVGARAEWPNLADRRISLTDYSLLRIVRYYREMGVNAKSLTTERLFSVESDAILISAVGRQ
jgi:hypothetical protein